MDIKAHKQALLCGSVLAAVALILSIGAPLASADEMTDALIELGKNFFFDTQLSTPRGKQACASCHDPRVGWTLPLDDINKTTVGAPGAQPGEFGVRKPQNNSYVAGFLGVYTPGNIGPVTTGGAFWDGRAEGCGASTNKKDCQVGSGRVSETITPDDVGGMHIEFLGPVADQALNPTSRPGIEQNTREKSVCQTVETAKYKDLFEKAWGKPIDCGQQGAPPAYHISFEKLAVAVAAWQGSPDVNSFTSPRNDCIRKRINPSTGQPFDRNGKFPCDNLRPEANLGHDLFYGRNDTGNNTGGPDGALKNAGCAACHNNKGPTSDGNEPDQIYTDRAYHSIALPFNRDLSRDDEDPGLFAHDDLGGPNSDFLGLGDKGLFKTPPLRNLTKNELHITKAYMHNGYFKNVANIVHYYNTRFDGTAQDTILGNPNPKTVCEAVGLEEATATEAIAANCWPVPEFPSTTLILGGLLGNLGLTPQEEAALVAFLGTLSDALTPQPPSTVK